VANTEKPQPTFYVGVACSILRDDPLSLTTPKNLAKDCAVLKQRTRCEGLSFLTKTLPQFAKDVLQALESGTSLPRTSFKLDDGGLPLFMGQYLKVIFGDGSPDQQAQALKHVLQVCHLCYKLELDFEDCAVDRVLKNFVDTEVELQSLELVEGPLLRVASSLLSDLLEGFDPKAVSPKHGPGAVATGEKLSQKWSFKRLYSGIHQMYPYYEYFIPRSKESVADSKSWYMSLQRLDKGCAKVVLVPKDSRGPRLISMEPLEYQFIQQGLGSGLVSWVERSPLTKGHVNFTDQGVNATLAKESSVTRAYDTLDLKDASDRVTVQLVNRLLPSRLTPYFTSVRTDATRLPTGQEIPLAKYAPMGSALCFPVLALTVWSLCVAAIMLTGITRENARKLVYVYGDDLIIAKGYKQACVDALESCGLRVNVAKCYSESYFRESCGMDAYHGVQVTPIRLRKLFPQGRERDSQAYAAYVQSVNAFRRAGYKGAGQFILDAVSKVYGPVPFGVEHSAYPCLIESHLSNAIQANKAVGIRVRWNVKRSAVEVRVWEPKQPTKNTDFDGWRRMLQSLLQRPLDPAKTIIRGTSMLVKRWRSVA
jgi:hypothetical protein